MSQKSTAESEKRLRVAVITGAKANDFAPLLEAELQSLGIETAGSAEGEQWNESEVVALDAGVFVVDEAFAKTWGNLPPRAFQKYPFGKIRKRFWLADKSHGPMAIDLKKELDPTGSFIPLNGPYNRHEAMWAAGQILAEMGETAPLPPVQSATRAHKKVQPAPGSARTRTPEERALDARLAQERHLRSGNETLEDLLHSELVGSILTDADDRAFRFAAAMSMSGTEPLIAGGVLVGYLLTAQDGTAEAAIATAVWHQYVITKRIDPKKGRPDFWKALSLTERRERIESLLLDTASTNGVAISPKLQRSYFAASNSRVKQRNRSLSPHAIC